MSEHLAKRIARVRGMTFSTPRVKSGLIRTLKDVQRFGRFQDAKGAYDYRVKDEYGNWLAEGEPGFLAAVEYQKRFLSLYSTHGGVWRNGRKVVA